MKRIICIAGCIFMLLSMGCTTIKYAGGDVKQKKAGEEAMETYASMLNKVWIVDRPERRVGFAFEFILIKAEDDEIEGFIELGGGIDNSYWSGYHNLRRACKPFKCRISDGKGKCSFWNEGYQVDATFVFCEDNRIEAGIRCDRLNINESHRFRPLNLTDKMLNDDILSTQVWFEAWGEVNLVLATTDSNHSITWMYLTDDNGDILYGMCCSHGLNGGIDFWDVFVEDINQDGRLDIWAAIYAEGYEDITRIVTIFYQAENGHFYEEEIHAGKMPEACYGEYRIARFCPARDYEEVIENVLTQEDVEQMLQKTIVIQEDSFVSYESERRTGSRENRKMLEEDNMIREYCFGTIYMWEPVSPDSILEGNRPDNRMREAVGEEYYEKIDGVFHNVYIGFQRFYTLEDKDELIMYSMMTGQYYVLKKI